MGLVTNEELCKVVWGISIIIKNFMRKYSFIVSELLRVQFLLSVLRHSHPTPLNA